MAQHFLLSAAARSVSLAKVLSMSDREAETVFQAIRWQSTHGSPVCPRCGCDAVYECRRPTGGPRWRCKACRSDFSLTSGTLFAFHKLPIRSYLAATVIFCNEVKGKAALALSRDLDVQYNTAFVLAHKIREAMASETKGMTVGGVGRQVELDGAHFGGHVRPANRKADRKDRRLSESQTGKRKVVVAIRERLLGGTSLGRIIPAVFDSEDAAMDFIKARVDRATTIHADESPAWNPLHARFDMKRINHSIEYSSHDACTNQVESFFSRIRRAEIGHHHRISGVYLVRYAQEAAWRETHRRDSNGMQLGVVVSLVTKNRPSVDFCGYWQRSKIAA